MYSRHSGTPVLHKLTAVVVSCTRPEPHQASPHSSVDEGGTHEPQLLADIDGHRLLRERGSVFFEGVAPCPLTELQGKGTAHRVYEQQHKED